MVGFASQPKKRLPEEAMGTSVTFKRPDGKEASGYLANAARGNAPCIVVIHSSPGCRSNRYGYETHLPGSVAICRT